MTRALVTGAGARLGRAIALELARRGHDVAIHYASNADAAASVAAEVRMRGRQAATLGCNLLDQQSTCRLVADAANQLGGPLDILVNNASIFQDDRLQTLTAESWEQGMGTNLHAPVILTRDFANQAPKVTRDAAGECLARASVINMIDQRVRHPGPTFFSYTLAKTALSTFTMMAAQSLAPDVRVNGIAPGPTLQSIHQSADDFANERLSTPLQRGSSPQDILHALRYLLDAPAVTGQVLYVDGGQYLSGQG